MSVIDVLSDDKFEAFPLHSELPREVTFDAFASVSASDPADPEHPSTPVALSSRRERPQWFHAALSKIVELSELEPGWHPDGAKAINPWAAGFAGKVLDAVGVAGVPEPTVTPGVDGSIQLEWEGDDHEVEICVSGWLEGTVLYVGPGKEGDQVEEERPLRVAYEELSKLRALISKK